MSHAGDTLTTASNIATSYLSLASGRIPSATTHRRLPVFPRGCLQLESSCPVSYPPVGGEFQRCPASTTGVSVPRTPQSNRETADWGDKPSSAASGSPRLVASWRRWYARWRGTAVPAFRIRTRDQRTESPLGGLAGQESEVADETQDRSLVGDPAAKLHPWQPLLVPPPVAGPSSSPTRGPAWLLALLDFVERAAGRATSLREHVTIVLVYAALFVSITGIVVAGAVVVLVEMMSIGSWPGMAAVTVAIAASGGAVFARRMTTGAAADQPISTAETAPNDSDTPGAPDDGVSAG